MLPNGRQAQAQKIAAKLVAAKVWFFTQTKDLERSIRPKDGMVLSGAKLLVPIQKAIHAIGSFSKRKN